MSLTSFLDHPDVRRKFRETFKKPILGPEKKILAPPKTKNYGLVGTAFDYMLRFFVKFLNSKVYEKPWIAEKALAIIPPNYFDQSEQVIKTTKKQYKDYLEDGKISDGLIKSCIKMGHLDHFYRSQRIDSNFLSVDERDVEDVRDLYSLLDEEKFSSQEEVVLNPEFGDASKIVGGADSDLFLDDALIEIKTSKNFSLRRDHFNQLIGYYILFRIGGIDSSVGKSQINQLGVYFSRYGYLVKFKIEDIAEEETFGDFENWFVGKCRGLN